MLYVLLLLDNINSVQDGDGLTLVGVDDVEDGLQVSEGAREHPLVETAPAPAHIALDTGAWESLLIYPGHDTPNTPLPHGRLNWTRQYCDRYSLSTLNFIQS